MPAEFVSAVVLLALVTDPFGNVADRERDARGRARPAAAAW
jgi:hypothetical protein